MKLAKSKLKQLIKEELEKIREMEYYDPGEESPERLLAREIGEKVRAALGAIAVEYDESSEEGDLNSWREQVWSVAQDVTGEADQF